MEGGALTSLQSQVCPSRVLCSPTFGIDSTRWYSLVLRRKLVTSCLRVLNGRFCLFLVVLFLFNVCLTSPLIKQKGKNIFCVSLSYLGNTLKAPCLCMDYMRSFPSVQERWYSLFQIFIIRRGMKEEKHV